MKSSSVWLTSMVISSRLRIVSDKPEFVKSLAKALKPDNLTVPPKMRIEDRVSRNSSTATYIVEVTVDCTAKDFDSLRGTLDEIQTLTAMVKNTLKKVKAVSGVA